MCVRERETGGGGGGGQIDSVKKQKQSKSLYIPFFYCRQSVSYSACVSVSLARFVLNKIYFTCNKTLRT